MAKKNNNKEQFEAAYNRIDALHGLSSLASVNDKVQVIIVEANVIMSKICESADQIKIHNFHEVTELYPDLGMPVNIWLELVNLRKLQIHTSLPEEVIQKITDQILGGNNVTALRESMITSMAHNSEIVATTINEAKKLDYSATEQLGEDFMDLLNDSASIRNDLDTELWPTLRSYGDAFSYVTGEPFNRFKLILDMYHYRNGGWPSDKTPPRFWSIVKRFKDAYMSLDMYGFDMAKNWSSRFGLDINVKMQSPTISNFSDDGELFGKYFMFKIRDEYFKQYESLGIQPWHHCIASQGRVFIYTWDTREITGIAMTGDFPFDHIHTGYVDNCQPLHSKVADITEKALQFIPDILILD